ncbi:hypothetical protein DPMN_181339 [Dreissena polymorpha]|uniref:Uncharacterized protein n=1 Tax=Dreissena polymorpha TaxID=45954 RepID=A0A9D4I1I7_DREPO|nr:hypothetical protein DPMN_181339 [Dreissena polymorpha]
MSYQTGPDWQRIPDLLPNGQPIKGLMMMMMMLLLLLLLLLMMMMMMMMVVVKMMMMVMIIMIMPCYKGMIHVYLVYQSK